MVTVVLKESSSVITFFLSSKIETEIMGIILEDKKLMTELDFFGNHMDNL